MWPTCSAGCELDFSDLYQEGLSCDSIKGHFAFDGAALTARDVSIESPSAAFEINGQADLAAQTLNQEVAMTLPLSSNLYAGCLAGPAVCAGILWWNAFGVISWIRPPPSHTRYPAPGRIPGEGDGGLS